MNAQMFANQVQALAMKHGINYLLVAEGIVKSSGTVDDIFDRKPGGNYAPKEYSTKAAATSDYTYEEIFDMFDDIAGNDPVYIESKDIEGFVIPTSAEYYMVVASNRKEFMIFSGSLDSEGDGGIPQLNVMINNDRSYTASSLKVDKDTDNIVTRNSIVIAKDSKVTRSLPKLSDIPTFITAEIEAFIIAVIQLTSE